MSGPTLVLLVAVLTTAAGACAGHLSLRRSAGWIALAFLVRLSALVVVFVVLDDYALSGREGLFLSVLALIPLFLSDVMVRERAAAREERQHG